MLRPDLRSAIHALLELESSVLSLDQIAQAIGALPVSPEEIDAVFAWLEQNGRVVGELSDGPASLALPAVLASARSLKLALGRTPKVSEIAEHSGLSLEAIQRALFFSKILQR